MRNILTLALLASLFAVVAVSAANKPARAATITHEPWGQTAEGQPVDLYTITNARGMQARIITYGGILVSLRVPDRHGRLADVVLGFDNLDDYIHESPYFGALIGRYGNRIANGTFTLDGVRYTLAKNNGPNSLHGGNRGFDKVVWKAKPIAQNSLALTYLSKDGEEGYPGNLSVTVIYALTSNNELRIDYSATTDKDTVLNLTNHSYFNLAGQGVGNVLGHIVTIHASRFTPVDSTLIPTGELQSVAGTPFDFRTPHAIGERINAQNQQLEYGHGYDHNFVLDRTGASLELAARVVEPKSGRVLEVLTTQPGLQFYTANQLDGSIHGKGGATYGPHAAFCMETQHFPDSPNHPSFPTTELKHGQRYHQITVYKFSTE
ncbi:MAG TPA: aldose epimerase family protein [Candidatus Aquilonibacter sp.]|nr:aldose epimerase family protein [Candidatus Aquilonibacter sp.]